MQEKPIQIPHWFQVNPLSVTLKASFPNWINITCNINSQIVIKGKNKLFPILIKILNWSLMTLQFIWLNKV